jgi:hypothetical protein
VLHTWKAQALEGLRRLFEGRDDVAALRQAHEREKHEPYAEIGRLASSTTWAERAAIDEREGAGLPLAVQGELLGLSRASLHPSHCLDNGVHFKSWLLDVVRKVLWQHTDPEDTTYRTVVRLVRGQEIVATTVLGLRLSTTALLG